MPLLADYDPGSGLVLAFIDPDDPVFGYQPTGAPVPVGVVPQRVAVETWWPDPYLPEYPELLGAAFVRWDEERGALRRFYPEADYSPETIRRAILARLDDAARSVLSVNDWVVIRRAETGVPIPGNIAAWRHAVRSWHADREVAAVTATPGELLAFDVTAPEWMRNPPRAAAGPQDPAQDDPEAVTP